MNSSKKIGDIIRSIREQDLRLTQEEFAEAISVTPETVSNIERGRSIPNTKTLVKLSETCSISADFLLGIPHKDNASSNDMPGIPHEDNMT